jgi:hypothetical protein
VIFIIPSHRFTVRREGNHTDFRSRVKQARKDFFSLREGHSSADPIRSVAPFSLGETTIVDRLAAGQLLAIRREAKIASAEELPAATSPGSDETQLRPFLKNVAKSNERHQFLEPPQFTHRGESVPGR